MASTSLQYGQRPGDWVRFVHRSGAWNEECAALYRESRCRAVSWRWSTKAPNRSSECLLELPGLEVLKVRLTGVDDSSIGRLGDLKELELLDQAENDLDLSALSYLQSLTLAWAERITGTTGLPALRHSVVLGFKGSHLSRIVGDNPHLQSLRLITEGPRSALSTDGLAGCPRLEVLSFEGHPVADLHGLVAVSSLLSLALHEPEKETHEGFGELDLEPLGGHASLEWLVIDPAYPRLRNLAALRHCPNLKGVSIPSASVRPRDVEELVASGDLHVDARSHGVVHVTRPTQRQRRRADFEASRSGAFEGRPSAGSD